MAGNRQAVVKLITEYLNGVDPSGFNTAFYTRNHFAYDDKKFAQWMSNIAAAKDHIIVYAPPESGVTLKYKRNLAFAKKKGIPIIERLVYDKQGDIPAHMTPVEYTVLPTIVRRQAQRWLKKNSVPDNMRSLNPLTGQPTGASQAAKMSRSELELLSAAGLESSLIEVMGPRGGDSGANAALTGMIVKTGMASLKALSAFSTGVDATKYMKAIFAAAMIKLAPL